MLPTLELGDAETWSYPIHQLHLYPISHNHDSGMADSGRTYHMDGSTRNTPSYRRNDIGTKEEERAYRTGKSIKQGL